MWRSASRNAPELPPAVLSVTGKHLPLLSLDIMLLSLFRYATSSSRTDNCLLSSVTSPVQNVGHPNNTIYRLHPVPNIFVETHGT